MANGRILYNNINSQFTLALTGGTAATGCPVTNVKDKFPFSTLRTTDKTASYITFTGTAASTVAAVVVVNHNVTTGTFKAGVSDNGSSWTEYDLVTKTMTQNYVNAAGYLASRSYRISYYIPASPFSKRDYRIKIDASGISDSYYEVGEVLLLNSDYTFTRNYMCPTQMGYKTQNFRTETTRGVIFQKHSYKRMEAELNFNQIESAQQIVLVDVSCLPEIIFFPTGTAGDNVYYMAPTLLKNEVASYVDNSLFNITVKLEEKI